MKLLFVRPPFLLNHSTSSNRLSKCTVRPIPRACSQPLEPAEPESSASEPSWLQQLAHDISPSADDLDPPRPPPEWEYPEEDSPVDTSAWGRWNDAMRSDSDDVAQRDPKAETDFWRGAARDIIDHDSIEPSPSTVSAPIEPTEPIDLSQAEDATSEHIWSLARGVTGQMSNMQENLKSELENFNRNENRDQYREIAKELTSPNNEKPLDDVAPIRPESVDAEAGSGWNPDVDWMRFDDLRHEQEKALEKQNRQQAELDARASWNEQTADMQDSSQTEAILEDNSPAAPLSASDQETLQPGFFADGKGMDELPPFLRNKYNDSGIYGSSWSGAEEEMENLKEQGVPLRDPKLDVDSWRSVARELNLDVNPDTLDENSQMVNFDERPVVEDQSDQEVLSSIESRNESVEAPSHLDVETAVERMADVTISEPSDISADTEDLDESHLDGETASAGMADESISEPSEPFDDTEKLDISQSWSQWRTGVANWQVSNENAPPRDPEKEVDMWRASARELVPDPSGNSTDSKSSAGGESGASPWDQWRKANTRWEAAIVKADEKAWQESAIAESKLGNRKKEDWGAGLDGKSSSERSAWDQWKSVSGHTNASDANLWWDTRSDRSFSSRGDAPQEESNEWGSAAEDMPRSGSPINSATPLEENREEKSVSMDAWRSIAKELLDAGPTNLESS